MADHGFKQPQHYPAEFSPSPPPAAPPRSQPSSQRPSSSVSQAGSAPHVSAPSTRRPVIHCPEPPTVPALRKSDRELPEKPILNELEEHKERTRLERIATVMLISFVAHSVIAIILSLFLLPMPSTKNFFGILSSISEVSDKPDEPIKEVEIPQENLSDIDEPENMPEEIVEASETPLDIPLKIDDVEVSIDMPEIVSEGPGPPTVENKGHTGGRSGITRQQLLLSQGGNAESELAVTKGLKWLVAQQQPDGGWAFNGKWELRNGATGMALMCFLGAGHTHEKGEYQRTVLGGLNYLLNNMQVGPEGGDLRGGGSHDMYAHPLATIALCEAVAMSRHRNVRLSASDQARFDRLSSADQQKFTTQRRTSIQMSRHFRRAAQAAINFCVNSQHPANGGWRYSPRSNGDTSVTGWYVMALKSGQSAELKVPRKAFVGSNHFLNSVSASRGAYYGYISPASNSPVTTSVGLLCRMYLGWTKDNPALVEGVNYLSRHGPIIKDRDMYYNYYATQVLHHWGGDKWKRWNEVMRDHLIETQKANGSWFPGGGGHSREAGILYETTLAIMTLEVYYRHLPLYQKKMITTEVP